MRWSQQREHVRINSLLLCTFWDALTACLPSCLARHAVLRIPVNDACRPCLRLLKCLLAFCNCYGMRMIASLQEEAVTLCEVCYITPSESGRMKFVTRFVCCFKLGASTAKNFNMILTLSEPCNPALTTYVVTGPF